MYDKIIAIRRDERFSLSATERDKAILTAVMQKIGGDIKLINEAELTEAHQANLFISMGRLPQTLSLLQKQEALGARIINKPKAVALCTRKNIDNLMRQQHIPIPPVTGEHGYWLKRGDDLPPQQGEIVFCKDNTDLHTMQQAWKQKGLVNNVVSAHVLGDIIKFYGVGNHFFYWHRVDNAPKGYNFDAKQLHQTVLQLAHIIDIEVFGGDCVVKADGTFCIIDFNDWPSFSTCRDEAASAIAQIILKR